MTRFLSRSLAVSLLLAPLHVVVHVAAQTAQPLRIDVTAERMRVDGMLNEWKGARFAELGTGDDASVRYALAVANAGLYLGAEVRDERLVTGDHGDALVLSLSLPEALPKAGWLSSEISLLPGEPGIKARALIKSGGQAAKLAPGIEVVEGPRKSGAGYVIEAFIPWAQVSGAELWEQGRGVLRFVDVDGKGDGCTLATASGKAAEMPRLALGSGHTDLLGSFMEAHQLVGTEPRYDFRANVAGDSRPERVLIIDRYVVVYGPGYLRGETSNFYALPLLVGDGLKTATLRDLTGDGRAELRVTLRQQREGSERELDLVLSLDEAGISPEMRSASTADASVAVSAETRKRPSPAAQSPAAQPEVASSADRSPQEASAQITPEAVVALFKRNQGLPSGEKPSRTLRANLVHGGAAEQVDVFGNVVLLTGSDIGQGAGYLTYALPVDDPRDVLDVRASDITSDGGDELLVRIRQRLSGAEGVERELLLVLRGTDQGGIARALLVEVARRQGKQAIENKLITRAGSLQIEPGTASGWTQKSYPFTREPIAPAGRLLLPWLDPPTRYRFVSPNLVPSP